MSCLHTDRAKTGQCRNCGKRIFLKKKPDCKGGYCCKHGYDCQKLYPKGCHIHFTQIAMNFENL